jgi:RTX calcium-binding nonapeptide repeat (4 copies)
MSARKYLLAALTLIGLLVLAPGAWAGLEPGTPGDDDHFGRDDDNASNAFIQPPGVSAPQHLNNTDVLFGRAGDDLLIGNLGDDVLPAGVGNDILVGGPEGDTKPGDDVLLGEDGDDIAVWSPGDGNEVFVGDAGTDVLVVAPFQRNEQGSLLLVEALGRTVPRVTIAARPGLECVVVPVPPTELLGVPYLVRFVQGGTQVATIRVKDVESVLCPSPKRGTATAIDLSSPRPVVTEVAIADLRGVVGAIVA